ncbi:uncharacterized protein LOC127260332 [Andrographis paniculata]|uniref:uncharacterized protein LOC127260332 n=1 Tax=Andrographis paniculata TaxID=175694 RepID=UPI0021E9211A|nr:uncharacterized protein LOC127260332 [Andrographis paniculata]
MNSSTQLFVPILEGKNYNRWSTQMKVLFDYQDLLDTIENGIQALTADATTAQRTAHAELKKKDKKALFIIHQGMRDDTFEQIEGASSAHEAWNILLTTYKGDDRVKRIRLQTLRRKYKLLQMEPSETIKAYVARVQSMTNNMKTNGETLTEQNKVEKILRTLTSRFEHIVAAIEEGNDTSTMTVKQLFGSLWAHG